MSNKRKDVIMAVISGATTLNEIKRVAKTSHTLIARTRRAGLIAFEALEATKERAPRVKVVVTDDGLDFLEGPDKTPQRKRNPRVSAKPRIASVWDLGATA